MQKTEQSDSPCAHRKNFNGDSTRDLYGTMALPVYDYENDSKDEEISSALHACRKMERVTLSSTLRGLCVFLNVDMPLLKSLTLCDYSESDLFRKLGLRAPNLRELLIYGIEQDNRGFEALAQNAPALQNAQLYFRERHVCPYLQEYFTVVENAVQYRTSRSPVGCAGDVSVLGVDYPV